MAMCHAHYSPRNWTQFIEGLKDPAIEEFSGPSNSDDESYLPPYLKLTDTSFSRSAIIVSRS